MDKDTKLKILLLEILISVSLCLGCIIAKAVFKQDAFLETLYNYLITDIVF